MRRGTVLALGLFILGLTLLAVSVLYGSGSVFLALIFPIYHGTDIWGFLGIICLIGALFIGFLTLVPRGMPVKSPRSDQEVHSPSKEPQKRFGGVIMLGPLPIIVGSDMKMSIVAMILAIIIIVILVVSMVLFLPGLIK